MAESPNGRPFVSVVVPVRNEEDGVVRAVESLLEQSYPAERMEIIVVVGASNDATRDRAAEIASANERVRVVDNPDGRTPIALNRGLDAARGELIGRLDGHAWADRDFIANAVEAIERTGSDGAGGIAEHVGRGAVGRAIALAMTSPLGSGNASFRVGGGECDADTIVFPLYRREVFERVGRYDEQLARNQDDEFNHRIRLAGGRLRFVPAVRSGYEVRSSLPAFWRQYSDYGRFRVVTIAKHGRPGALRQLAPPLLAAGLAGGLALDALSGGRTKLGRRVVGAYAAAVTAGGFAEAARADEAKLGPLVGVSLATMHLAYGYGFWREAARRVKPAR